MNSMALLGVQQSEAVCFDKTCSSTKHEITLSPDLQIDTSL